MAEPGADDKTTSEPTTTGDTPVMQRFYFVVHGTVQGVGFRQFTKKRALGHKVTGWCRNTIEETVEGEAQADAETLEAFFRDVRRGPPSSEVTDLKSELRDVVDTEEGFRIRH